MDLEYFRTQIEDELNGAADYKSKAEECPEFAETFNDMSQQELGHAKNLMNMLKKQIEESEQIYKNYAERLNG